MPGEDKKTEIRGGTKERLLGTAAGWLLRIYSWTLRVKFEDRSGLDGGPGNTVAILAFWHNRIFAVPRGLCPNLPTEKMVVLTIASKDGAILGAAVEVFGTGSVRGSSSRRGRAAMVALMRCLREGVSVVVTPDGPRGPRYELQPGLVKLAQAGGVPVVPVTVDYSRAWRLNSWDRFQIPWPFSSVRVVLQPALDVPRDLSEDAFEEQRKGIEAALREGVDDLLTNED